MGNLGSCMIWNSENQTSNTDEKLFKEMLEELKERRVKLNSYFRIIKLQINFINQKN